MDNLCRIVKIWIKLGELVKARDIFREITKGISQSKFGQNRERAYNEFQYGLIDIINETIIN